MESAKKNKPKAKRLSSADRKAQILHAAIEFFSEEGFDGSTHRFAKKLGITQPLIYRYFPSKDDLVREVYNTIFESRWRDDWEQLLKDRERDLAERLFEFYIAYTDVVFSREWTRIYLFSGLKGLDINRWWSQFVESRILSIICGELRHQNGRPSVADSSPSEVELEMLWSFQGSIFYYAMRRDVYRSKVHLDFTSYLRLMIETLIVSFRSNGLLQQQTGIGI